MNNNKEFMNKYKELETELRDQNLDYLELENQSENSIQNKMRVCRIMRNYMAHNAETNFVQISDAQLEFINDILSDIKAKTDTAKKRCKTINATSVDSKAKCTDALTKMIKTKRDKILIIGCDKLKIASIYDVSKAVLESKTSKMDKIKSTSKYIIVNADTKCETIPKNTFVIVTTDGTTTGKLIGTIQT